MICSRFRVGASKAGGALHRLSRRWKSRQSVQSAPPLPAASSLIEPICSLALDPACDQNAVVLNELFRIEFPALGVGDKIRLKIGTKESDWIVVGFFQFAGKAQACLLTPITITCPGKQDCRARPVSTGLWSRVKNLGQQDREWLGRQIENAYDRAGI